MSTVQLVGVVSVDGFIAAADDTVGSLFDWYGNGDVEVILGDPSRPFRMSRASADHVKEEWLRAGVTVIGRHLFDLTNGWGGVPPSGEHVVVVTHEAPTDWPHPDAPFTFVTGGVESAVAHAKELAGDRNVAVTAGDVGGQALELGLIDEVHQAVVPVVFGRGKPFFGSAASAALRLEDPRLIVQGDRVTHVVYPVRQTQ